MLKSKFSTRKYKSYGFGILDSFITLFVVGCLTVGFGNYLNNQNQRNNAKKYAEQTLFYAQIYDNFVQNSNIISQITGSTSIISTDTLITKFWNNGVSKTGMFNQKPCLLLYKDPSNENIEGVLVYSGPSAIDNNLKINEMTAMLLGYSGGLIIDGSIRGNSGWVLNNSSQILSSTCGNSLPKYGVAVNLDLISSIDSMIQPNTALTRTPQVNKLHIAQENPGHMLNSNTSKSDIYVRGNNGLDNGQVLLNTTNNSTLKIVDDGSSTNSPLVSVTSNTKSTVGDLNVDQLSLTQSIRTGGKCEQSEIGKAVINAASYDPNLSKVLSRGTLVCTYNANLCGLLAASNQCYLPTQPNNVIYNNLTIGSSSVNFRCPTDTPFLTGISNVKGTIPLKTYSEGGIEVNWLGSINTSVLSINGFNITALRSVPNFSISNQNINVGPDNILFNYNYYLYNNYRVNIGINLDKADFSQYNNFDYNTMLCNLVPNGCKSNTNNNYTQFSYAGYDYSALFSYSAYYINYKGTAVIIQHPKEVNTTLQLDGVTCSNMPLYTSQ